LPNKLGHWLRGKRGRNAAFMVLALLLVVLAIGQAIGWSNIGRLITGTAGLEATGYSCFPSCAENDGKFLILPGEDMAAFGGPSLVVWIEVPARLPSFEIGFFDGDSGKDGAGRLNAAAGNWDSTEADVTYTLYADPAQDGAGDTVLGRWRGNQDSMPNNGWHEVTIQNVADARGANNSFHYRLEASRSPAGSGISAFKLRATGQLVTGRSDIAKANVAIAGVTSTPGDVAILFPESGGDLSNPGPSTYSGAWEFYFDIGSGVETITLWDGDFDRGTSADVASDTDDPNTAGIPPFAAPSVTLNEGARGKGNPADDNLEWPLARRRPPIRYKIFGPQGELVFANENPSGSEEWEKVVISAALDTPDEEIDTRVEDLPAGVYSIHIEGLDLQNVVWLNIDYGIRGNENWLEPQKQEPTTSLSVLPTPAEGSTTQPAALLEALAACADPAPIDLLYVLDISGSMNFLYPGSSGTKLEATQQAILTLNEWVADQDNGSRVALITFHGEPHEPVIPPPPTTTYPTEVQLVSAFTTDIEAFNELIKNLEASSTTPTAEALNLTADWFPEVWDRRHLPVAILISDGVPTVDLDLNGFLDDDVAAVDLHDATGDFRTIDEVRSSGAYYSAYDEQAGEPLADTMLATQNLKTHMPDVLAYAVAIQAVQGGVFNDAILRYVAVQGNGEFFTAQDTDELCNALQEALLDSACDSKHVIPELDNVVYMPLVLR